MRHAADTPDVVGAATAPAADRCRILLVAHEWEAAAALERELRTRDFDVTVARSASAALQEVEVQTFDTIVLDLGGPDVDEIEHCRLLRVWVRCPIIVMTDDGRDQLHIDVLDAGADDYIVKPYNVEVLAARIRVAMRHAVVLAATVEDEFLVCGDLQVDVAGHRARIGERDVAIQPRQFTLLVTLLRNAGRLVPHRHLSRVLWNDPGPSDAERLRAAISTLRRKLGHGPRRPRIETEATVGYRLVAPD